MNHPNEFITIESTVGSALNARPTLFTAKIDGSRQSQQIALLNDCLEMDSEGLKHPACLKHGDDVHFFDFYDPTGRFLIKVFNKIDIAEMRLFERLSQIADMMFIFDEEPAACGMCEGCQACEYCHAVEHYARQLDAYVFAVDCIFEYDPKTEEWLRCIPVLER